MVVGENSKRKRSASALHTVAGHGAQHLIPASQTSRCFPRSASPREQFSEEQIIGILKEAEAGAVVTELCRKHGMSSATYYAWKAKYGGLEVSEAKRLRALEDENGRLKRLLADAMLDNAGLKDLLAKKW